MLLRILNSNTISNFHDLVGNEVPDSPRLIHCKLLDVRHQILVNLIVWQSFCEVNTAIDALHSHGILIILIEIAKNLEKILLGHQWDELDHIVQNEGCALSDLRDFVLGSLSEKTIFCSIKSGYRLT